MNFHHHQQAAPKKSRWLRNILYFVTAGIILMGLYYHVQSQTVLIVAVGIILAHLAVAGGVAHIIPALRKRFHGEPD